MRVRPKCANGQGRRRERRIYGGRESKDTGKGRTAPKEGQAANGEHCERRGTPRLGRERRGRASSI
eukprot:6172865-Pleurochrysis_carterae.AAC.3